MKRSLIVAVMLFMLPTLSHAGEFSEWLSAGWFVYLRHEIGHQEIASSSGFTWTYTRDRMGIIPDYRVDYKPVPSYKEAAALAKRIADSDQQKWTVYLSQLKTMPKGNEISSFAGKISDGDQQEWADFKKQQQNIYEDNCRTSAEVGGAGFVAQQIAVESLPDGPFKRKATILSGLLKAGYVPYYYSSTKDFGDIAHMSDVAPARLISTALLVSALTDIWRAEQAKIPAWRIDFLSDPRSGAVGLAYASSF